jgi:hypothetical protein
VSVGLFIARVDPLLGFIASKTTITSKGAIDEALDSRDAIYLVNSLFIELQPLIGEQRAPEEDFTVPSHQVEYNVIKDST